MSQFHDLNFGNVPGIGNRIANGLRQGKASGFIPEQKKPDLQIRGRVCISNYRIFRSGKNDAVNDVNNTIGSFDIGLHNLCVVDIHSPVLDADVHV